MLRVRHKISDYGKRVDLVIIDENEGRRLVAKPLVFEDTTDNLIEDPTLTIDFWSFDKEQLATFFLDWIKLAEDLNIKLNQDFTKERAAMSAHLEDMRQLVFKKGYEKRPQ